MFRKRGAEPVSFHPAALRYAFGVGICITGYTLVDKQIVQASDSGGSRFIAGLLLAVFVRYEAGSACDDRSEPRGEYPPGMFRHTIGGGQHAFTFSQRELQEEFYMGYYITVERNVNLFVEDIDPGNGKPILFIHGWPVNHKMFEYQFNELPKLGYRCIGMDLRGYGQSDRPWGGYTYDRMADDVRAVVETLGLDQFTLAGFSIGGAIAIRYMARYPEHRVSKLALFAAAAPVYIRKPDYPHGANKEDVNKMIQAVYTDRPQVVSSFGDIFFARYVTDSFKDWFNHMGLEASGHATAQGLIALRDEDLRNDLPKINVPTAIFHGEQDKVCPFAFAGEQQAGIRGSVLVPFPLSGHGLFYCEKDKFNRELIHFIG